MIKLSYNGNYFTDGRNAVHLPVEEVQEMIDSIEKDLLESKEKFSYASTATGDTLVFGVKRVSEDWYPEINIYVTQNYSEAELYEENGEWKAVNWYEESLEDMDKEDLIEEVRKLRAALYNPNKEY